MQGGPAEINKRLSTLPLLALKSQSNKASMEIHGGLFRIDA
jgi:hypothetical protein